MALDKATLEPILQSWARWLLDIQDVARHRHEQLLLNLPDQAGLQAAGYTAAEASQRIGIAYQYDRLQTLLGGTVPGSASDVLADACIVLGLTG